MYQPSPRNSFRRFVMETGWTLFSSLFLALAGFLLNVLLGNRLGEENFGIYTVAATIYMLATTLAVLGLPVALTKYTAEFIDSGEVGAQFYTASLVVTLGATLTGGLGLYVLRYPLSALCRISELVELLPVLAVGIPFYGLNKIAIARLNGLRQMGRMSMGEILRYLLMIGLTGGTVVGLGWGLAGAIWALALAEIMLFPILWILTKLHRNLCWTGLKKYCQMLVRVGGQVVLARIIADLDARLGILLISVFLSKAEIGIYALAALMADSLSLLPVALEKVTGPAMAELYARKQTDSLELLSNQTTQLTVFLLTFTGIGLVMFFPQIVRLLYPDRPAFLLGEVVLGILVIGSVFQGIVTSVGPVFVSVNRPEVLFRINLARLLVNSLATLVLVNVFRMEGAALGKTVTILFIFALRTRTMESVAQIRADYKPLLLIPLLGTLTVLIARLEPGGLVLSNVVRFALWGTFALVVTRLWNFDRYLVRLYRLVVPS